MTFSHKFSQKGFKNYSEIVKDWFQQDTIGMNKVQFEM